MASNYTEHYGLCQWEATDQVLRGEFNQDNAKVDEALGTLEQMITRLSTRLAAQEVMTEKLGNCELYTATYSGNGSASVMKHTFPGNPVFIMVSDTQYGTSFVACRGMTNVSPHYQSNGSIRVSLTWQNRSVTWNYSGGADWNLNASGRNYTVMALLDMSA